jgi:hypothetical protein
MRGKIRRLSPFLFILLFGLILNPLLFVDRLTPEKTEGIGSGIAHAQLIEGEGKGERDSHYIELMKQLRTKVDGWLKDLNDRIESGDVTRFEIRFLEILRSVLEWLREKIDGQIGPEQKQKDT